MQSIRLFVGACAAVLLGAVTGASIDTTPLERRGDAGDLISRPEASAAEFEANAEPQALPDHYPLITPQGRFEVEELRLRGLYRNRRFAMSSWWVDDFEPAYEVAAADYRYLPYDTPEPEPATSVRTPPSEEPPVLAVDAAPLAAGELPQVSVKPRTVEVAAIAPRN